MITAKEIEKAVKASKGDTKRLAKISELLEDAFALGLTSEEKFLDLELDLECAIGNDYGDDVLISFFNVLNGAEYNG